MSRNHTLTLNTRRLIGDLQHVFDAVAEAIWVVDAEDRVVLANRAVNSLSGRGPEETIGGSWQEVIFRAGELPPKYPAAEARATGARRFAALRYGDHWLRVTVDPIIDQDRNYIGAVHMVADITDRKRIADTLRATEQQLHDVLEYTQNLHYTHTPDHRLTYVSPQSIHFLGCTPEEAMVHWTDFATDHPANVAGFVATQTAIRTGERQPPFELQLRRRDGRIIWVIANEAPVVKDGKTVRIVGSLTDITERKNTEDRLRESEAKYRRLVEGMSATHGIFSHTPEGVITYISHSCRTILGLEPGDIVGRNWRSLDWTDASRRTGEQVRENTRVGAPPVTVEMTYRHPDGSARVIEIVRNVVSEDGEVVSIEGIFSDVTERRRIADELQYERALYMDLVNAQPAGLYRIREFPGKLLTEESFLSTTVAPFTVEMVSDRFCELLKLDRDTVMRNPAILQKRILEEDRPDFARKNIAATASATPFFWEGRVHVGDEVRWMRFESRPRLLDSGDTVWTGMLRDITERRRVDEQLQGAQRMEAVGRLAGGVAHDFNNALGVILGFGEQVLEKLRPGDPLRKDVEMIIRAAERSGTLTRQLLTFSRKQPLQSAPLSINALLQDLMEMLKRLLGESIGMESVLAADLPQVTADAAQLERVVINLVINARDAMPNGGTLTIETARAELDERYARRHPGIVPGNYVMFSVTDTGVGMDTVTMTRIFEPFFTTKDHGKGTGLGLSSVYGIVTQSGGSIDVSSHPGGGSTFKVYLPALDEGLLRPQERSVDVKPASTAGGRILLVEDEPALRDLFARMLTRVGHEVTVAANGQEALAIVKERGLMPDLVITDVVMPEMGGPAMMKRLWSEMPNLRAIYMSGYPDRELDEAHHLARGTSFIQKPFGAKDIIGRVAEMLQRVRNDATPGPHGSS